MRRLFLASVLAAVPALSTAQQPIATQPGQMRAKSLLDRDVYSSDNHEIGEVEDLILDAQGRVTGVVIELESDVRRNDRHVLVPFDQLRPGERRRWSIPMTRDQVRNMAGYAYRD